MSDFCKNHNEELLLKRLVNNSEGAFREFYVNYKDDIYAYSKSMLKDRSLAEEIVQEVFMKVWLNRASLDPTLSFKAYVFRLARNMTINVLKKAANEEKLKKIIFYKTQNDFSPSVDVTINEKDYNELRNRIIQELPPRRKLIFEMSRNEGLSYQEIGLKLGISESTVKTQMSKALETIRTFLCKHTDVTFVVAILYRDML